MHDGPQKPFDQSSSSRPIVGPEIHMRTIVVQQKTGRPVQTERRLLQQSPGGFQSETRSSSQAEIVNTV
jgi:hypothetical protein